MNDQIKRVSDLLLKRWNKALEKYTEDQLALHGFAFETKEERDVFVKTRLHLVSYPSAHENEIYLDYKSPSDPGTLIGRYSTRVDFKNDGEKITMTIG